MYTTEELLANLPDFERVRIQGGRTPYAQPALPPVRKAQMDSEAFLADYLAGMLAGGSRAA